MSKERVMRIIIQTPKKNHKPVVEVVFWVVACFWFTLRSVVEMRKRLQIKKERKVQKKKIKKKPQAKAAKKKE